MKHFIHSHTEMFVCLCTCVCTCVLSLQIRFYNRLTEVLYQITELDCHTDIISSRSDVTQLKLMASVFYLVNCNIHLILTIILFFDRFHCCSNAAIREQRSFFKTISSLLYPCRSPRNLKMIFVQLDFIVTPGQSFLHFGAFKNIAIVDLLSRCQQKKHFIQGPE